jgi:hypothetical protein
MPPLMIAPIPCVRRTPTPPPADGRPSHVVGMGMGMGMGMSMSMRVRVRVRVSMTRWSRCMVRTVLRTCTVLSLRVTGYYHVFNAPEKMRARARAREWPGRDPSRGTAEECAAAAASPRLTLPQVIEDEGKMRCCQLATLSPNPANAFIQTGRAKRVLSLWSRPVQHTVTAPSGIWNLDSGFWILGALPCNISVPGRVLAGRKLLFQIALQPWKYCSRSSRGAACTSPPLAPLHHCTTFAFWTESRIPQSQLPR